MLRPRTSLASLPLVAVAVVSAAAASVAGCGGSGTPGTGGGSSSSSSGAGGGLGSADDILSSLPQSCALDCGSACAEPETAFACPTVLPWAQLPHDDACGGWDGTYPAVTPGKCSASVPTGDAIAPTGPITGGVILPDGHRILPAGRDFVFAETDLQGGFPMSITALAGTHFALVADGGIIDNALRLIDLDALASGGAPVAAYTPFHEPTSLYWGMAWLPPGSALASGGGDGKVYAFDVDTTQGTLARATTRDIAVGMGDDGSPYYVGPIARPRPTAASSSSAPRSTPARSSSTRWAPPTTAPSSPSSPWPPPASSTSSTIRSTPPGTLFYATDMSGGRLVEIDAAAGKVTRTVALDKNPQQVVFLDATYAVIAEADSDEIALVDRAAGTVASQVPIFTKGAPHGPSPSAVTYDPATQQLYATLAGINAVEVFTVTPGTPPTIAPAGRIPTAWWPSGVLVDTDGSLVVITGQGHGTGTDDKQYTWGQGVITERMHGSIQRVPAALLGDLATQTTIADQNHHVAALAGQSAVTCPTGAADFPVPADNVSGPSAQIKHVILVVLENTTYDAVFGDRADLGNGDPTLIMASDPVLEGKIWQNGRAIAKAFTNFDNFYTDAEQSIQGHTWTVFGRTTDYMERTWLSIWGRGTRTTATTTLAVDGPLEGGVFQWMTDNNVSVDDMGEIIGNFMLDDHYPGLIYAQGTPDVDKSCYVAGRIRLSCDLASFTYAVQPNDHTDGGSAGSAAPEVMIAVNDEASGMILDGLSHSPIWKDSLLILTEDDPQDGGDHVDDHRSVLLMASPWVRRAYVSHGHYDMASVYKLVAHIFGIPYHNDMIANAMAPFDAFTSTPDYTPYTYQPRTVNAPCNASAGPHAKMAERWDWDDPDDQPGLSQQIMRMMKEPRAARGVRVLP